jgi:hypothetical protein
VQIRDRNGWAINDAIVPREAEIQIFQQAHGLPFDRAEMQRRLADIDLDALQPTASAKELLRVRAELVDLGLP